MSAAPQAPPAPGWQESTVLDFVGTPAERFERIIRDLPPRTHFTVNDIRDRLDAADIPVGLRGGLMFAARAAGLIEPLRVKAWGRLYDVRVRSAGRSAKGATVRVFRRLPDAHDDGRGQ